MLHHLDRRAARLIALSLAVSAIAWPAAQPATPSARAGHRARRRAVVARAGSRTCGAHAPRRASSATVSGRPGRRVTPPRASARRTRSTAAWASTTPTRTSSPTASSTSPSRRSSSTSRCPAASCGSARSSTSRRTPTRTSPPTPTGPSLFDLPFDGPMLGHDAGMPIHYDLHVWLYRHNPAGLFAMWNPRVHCPDGGQPESRRAGLEPLTPSLRVELIQLATEAGAAVARVARKPATPRAHAVVARVVLDVARPGASITGGRVVCRSGRATPLLSPSPSRRTGLSSARARASTVPSAAGFCSSALPSGTQSPRSRSIASRSSRRGQRRW